jgi:hypothetical protein
MSLDSTPIPTPPPRRSKILPVAEASPLDAQDVSEMLPAVPVRSSNWRAGTSSLLLHVLALVTIALVFSQPAPQRVGGERVRTGEIVLAVLAEDSSETTYEAEEQSSADSADVDEQPALPSNFSSALELPQATPAAQPLPGAGTPVDLLALDANQMANPLQQRPQSLTLSEADIQQMAREQQALASRPPVGPTAKLNVFGSGEIEGRRFVFVIDRSASMGGQGLGVLARAEVELARAINGLTEDHWFQIVPYHGQATMMGQRAMLPATSERKQQVTDFVASLAAFGSTQHESGLYTALALKPDVIIFMTDGGYPELNPAEIDAFVTATRRHVVLHALQFGAGPNRPSNNFMQRLASETGGSYSYIDVTQWKR